MPSTTLKAYQRNTNRFTTKTLFRFVEPRQEFVISSVVPPDDASILIKLPNGACESVGFMAHASKLALSPDTVVFIRAALERVTYTMPRSLRFHGRYRSAD